MPSISTASSGTTSLPLPQGPGSSLYPTTTPLEGMRSVSLAEVLRMDVTKQWVYERWPRKSTGLADLEHYGIRVPLVTGTGLADLAGSLTYFFGGDGQVERISFRGSTGDTTQLVMLVVQRFGLQRQPTTIAGEQLFQVRRGEQVFSELRTRPASVLWSSSPHNSFQVEMELQRPDINTPLPSRSLVADLGPSRSPSEPSATQAATDPSQTADATEAEGASATEPTPQDSAEGWNKWNALFPRSKLPPGQIENLEQRRRKW